MPETEAEIAVVEDRKGVREDFEGWADDLKGGADAYSVNVPPSFDDMQRLFLFRNLDGLLIDVNLQKWDLSKRLIKRVGGVGPIEDGIDVANLAFNLFRRAKDAIYIYSSEVDLDLPKWRQKLDSLPFKPTIITKLLNYREAEEYLKLLLKKAGKVKTTNPLLQPPALARMSDNERIQAYKSVYFNSAKWMECNFNSIGDYSWVVVCGHCVEKDSYGRPLNGVRGDKFGIQPMSEYPDVKALKAISKRHNHFPFIFWNARKPEFLEQQFKQAGEELENIPRPWRSFFGVAMASLCAKAYVDNGERRVLNWCRQLDEFGKLEAMKRIYKRLLRKNSSNLSEFKRAARRLDLPEIVDVLEAKVEEIDEKQSKAVVGLQSSLGGPPFGEVFDLRILRQGNIKFAAQRFDYTVYQRTPSHMSAYIEPHYEGAEDE